jgi:hypothetical protein
MSEAHDLVVEYCGESYSCAQGNQFTFGRSGDLVIDDNHFLHRIIGICAEKSGWWWLTNVGASLPLHLQAKVGGASITLSPGGSVPLVLGPTDVRFTAGVTTYELLLDAPWVSEQIVPRFVADGFTTIDAADMPLSSEQLLLLVALAESRLRKGPTAELPSNQEVVERFGWTTTKFNRKLDGLCVKFARRGVSGLVGEQSRLASQRRQRLVDHVINSGMVTADQLVLLPPRRANGARGEAALPGTSPRSASSDSSVSSVQPSVNN